LINEYRLIALRGRGFRHSQGFTTYHGYMNIPWVYECLGSPNIDDVVTESPAPGTNLGDTQPVSLKLQAGNC
jgi:serine/threonine-protein kinase